MADAFSSQPGSSGNIVGRHTTRSTRPHSNTALFARRRYPAPWLVASARPKSGKKPQGPPPFTPSNPPPTHPAHLGPRDSAQPAADMCNPSRHQARVASPAVCCAVFSASCPLRLTTTSLSYSQIFGEMLEEKQAVLQALAQRDPEVRSTRPRGRAGSSPAAAAACAYGLSAF